MLEPIDLLGVQIAKSAVKAVATYIQSSPDLSHGSLPDYERAIATATQDAIIWASRMQMFGMPQASDPSHSAIPLRMHENQRRFQKSEGARTYSEDDLLQTSSNVLILGDPGSGKTTTIKRIVQRTILDSAITKPAFLFPVVVRFREMHSTESLLVKIARSMGLNATPPKRPKDQVDERTCDDPYWIGNVWVMDALAGFFADYPVLLAFDGLDEFEGDRRAVRRQLTQLSRAAPQAKLIISCRTGDYSGGLEGFSVYQICALSKTEVHAIVSNFGVDANAFTTALASVPYRDLADRPLFLTLLLVLFRKEMSLPEQPSDIYHAIVLLVLREWDEDGNVVRRSRYAGFSHIRKHKFLAALSYVLTVKIKAKNFSTWQLIDAYAAIRARFDLPEEEAALVVEEIESHSGLIIHAGPGQYEFSHLSLQEYLAADYMSREARGANLQDYLKDYPAPVAVAVTLSSDPADTLASICLGETRATANSITSFINRLVIERPLLSGSGVLGVALIYVVSKHSLDRMIDPLFQLKGVKESIREGFRDLDLCKSEGRWSLTPISPRRTIGDYVYPHRIEADQRLIERLIILSGGSPRGHCP